MLVVKVSRTYDFVSEWKLDEYEQVANDYDLPEGVDVYLPLEWREDGEVVTVDFYAEEDDWDLVSANRPLLKLGKWHQIAS